jgi:AraC-like DNA-binding protein
MKEYISDIVCDRKCLAYIDDIQNISSMLQNEDDFEKMVDIFMDNFRYDRHFADKKNIIASIAGIIHKGKGNINIAKIAEEVGYNQRYLDRVFKEAVGVSMKKYAEIIRIQKAIYYLQNSLTYEIYERLGYYDQAHFIKDFKKNTSLTPSRFERANSQYKIV